MIDYPQMVYSARENERYLQDLKEHPIVLNVGGVSNRSRLVIHRNNCRFVRELKRNHMRTRKMLFKNRSEMMENLPNRSVRLIECENCHR